MKKYCKAGHKIIIFMDIILILVCFNSLNAMVWNWEDGTLQGWKAKDRFEIQGDTLALANSTAQAYDGMHSLKWHIKGFKDDSYWYVYVANPMVELGEPVVYHVWVPAGAAINGFKTFMKDQNGGWVDGNWYGYGGLNHDGWNELNITVPTNLPQPFRELGLQIATSSKQADLTIYLDQVVSGIPSQPKNLSITPLGQSEILLNWDDVTDRDLALYRVYRDTLGGFSIDKSNLRDSSGISQFQDTGLELYRRYYYKVTTVDLAGNESAPSAEASVFLTRPGTPPVVQIKRTNKNTVGLYEKFEVLLDLKEATFSNPYDAEEIDVRAVFTSPSGKQWRIFGFYDDYQSASAWKIRFAPSEIGQWSFYVLATDLDGTGQSDTYQLTAVPSAKHGWLHVSPENPHYLVHDDGTPYYGVGVYLPWGESPARLDHLAQYNANMFAIWNIMYGGLVNSFGIIEAELGRYNQMKCGRMDSLIHLSEQRGLNIMFCIWPHDLFSSTVWAHQWHQNPYRFVCDVTDVYSNAQVWEYQKKQYRYLIARFGYSPSLAIWEIINEMNGTDGWAAGRYDDAYEWVRKVDQYLNENDPFGRPTTASFSGGKSEYRAPLYDRCDMPNIHIYETQGWSVQYPGNLLRSSMKNFKDGALRFWDNFTKPALFGEAAYDATYYPPRTPEYTKIYHNALWACLTNGLSMTPVWWDYSILTDNEFKQMQQFKKFVQTIDFITGSKAHFEFSTDNYDLFGMSGDSTAFGWIRDVFDRDISNIPFEITGVLNKNFDTYQMQYFDTWTGQFVETHVRPFANGQLIDFIPDLTSASPDIAFKITPVAGGITPTQIELMTLHKSVLNLTGARAQISCYLMDEQGRFCGNANNLITFSIRGSGTFVGPNQIQASKGIAEISYQSGAEIGSVKIIATSAGLTADTLEIEVTNKMPVDDFERYPSDISLQAVWITQAGTRVDAFIEKNIVGSGGFAMRLEYGIGGSYRDYVRIEKSLNQDYSGAKYFSFWYQPDGSNRTLSLRIRDAVRVYMDYRLDLIGTTPQIKEIALTDFVLKSGADSINLANLIDITIRIDKGLGGDGTSTLYFDDLQFLTTSSATGVTVPLTESIPTRFHLEQNYPNPFNHLTMIRYSIASTAQVKINVYNEMGQQIARLLDARQNPGRYSIQWDASELSSGIYFIRLQTDALAITRKSLLLK